MLKETKGYLVYSGKFTLLLLYAIEVGQLDAQPFLMRIIFIR